MILTVTLNAAIDRTVAVPNFRLGHRHRAVESRTVAGGKGVNVARALKLLGRPVIATGLAGGPTGARILERLAEESILNDFTRIEGESRTNLAVIDPTSGEQTEINERGPEVDPDEVDRFIEKLALSRPGREPLRARREPPARCRPRHLRPADRRAPPARACRRCSTPTASRCASACAPSRRWSRRTSSEAEGAVGHEFNDADDFALGLAGPARDGRPRGGHHPRGGMRRDRRQDGCRRRYEVEIEPLEPVSGVGSGDCFLAGYVAARYEGGSAASASPTASPAAPSRPSTSAPGSLDPQEVERLLPRVEVRELDVPAGVG